MMIYLLMANHRPVDAYLDKALAMYDTWLMTEAERYDENPTDYWVKAMDIVEETMDAVQP